MRPRRGKVEGRRGSRCGARVARGEGWWCAVGRGPEFDMVRWRGLLGPDVSCRAIIWMFCMMTQIANRKLLERNRQVDPA